MHQKSEEMLKPERKNFHKILHKQMKFPLQFAISMQLFLSGFVFFQVRLTQDFVIDTLLYFMWNQP